jgi:hypothetical protein
MGWFLLGGILGFFFGAIAYAATIRKCLESGRISWNGTWYRVRKENLTEEE